MIFFKRKSDLEKRVAELERCIDLLSSRLRTVDIDHETWRREFNAATRRHNDVMEKWAEALLKAVSK
jgi:chromosome segregation ATPase